MQEKLHNSELHEIANRAAEKAVEKMLLTLGVDVSDPEAIIRMQKDFQWLRSFRQSGETIKTKAITTVVGIFITGIVAAIWMAFKPH